MAKKSCINKNPRKMLKIKKEFKIRCYAQSSKLTWFMIILVVTEAAIGGVVLKMLFLKTSQNSQVNTSAGVSFE